MFLFLIIFLSNMIFFN